MENAKYKTHTHTHTNAHLTARELLTFKIIVKRDPNLIYILCMAYQNKYELLLVVVN